MQGPRPKAFLDSQGTGASKPWAGILPWLLLLETHSFPLLDGGVGVIQREKSGQGKAGCGVGLDLELHLLLLGLASI